MKFLNLCFIIFFFLSADLYAEKSLNLKDCFNLALKRSQILAEHKELIIQAEEIYRRSWAEMLPTVDGSYSYAKDTSSFNQRTFKIMFEQSLFKGFRSFNLIKSREDSITAKKQAKKWASLQLYSDTAQAFYTYLSIEKDIKVLDKEFRLYEKRIKELKERLAIGRSRITEVLTLESSYAVLKAEKEQVLGELDVAKEVLYFFTGLDKDIKLIDNNEVSFKLKSLESYQFEIDNRPDIKTAKKNIEVFNSEVAIAKGERLPSVDLTSNYYNGSPDLNKDKEWDIGVTVSLPIFSGGVISSDIKTALSQKRQSEIQLDQAKKLAEKEINSLYYKFKTDMAQYKAIKEALNIAKKNYKANVNDYKLNLVTNLDMLQALMTYQSMERSLWKKIYSVKIDYYKLEAVCGRIEK